MDVRPPPASLVPSKSCIGMFQYVPSYKISPRMVPRERVRNQNVVWGAGLLLIVDHITITNNNTFILERPTSIERSPPPEVKMDPDRVKAYLQVACTGLGFDIGEIWWTSDDNTGASSALMAIGELPCCQAFIILCGK
jgi:hypothetical protein